jgi:hypothetical protein
MALYEPIRDSFREFNRMLIDAQTWDERHAQRESDKKYKHAVLQSNITQRAFENEMSAKSMDLRNKGETRAAADLELRTSNQSFQHKRQTEGDKRSVDELAIAEATRSDAKRRNQQIYDIANKPYVKKDVDFNGFIPDHLKENGEFMTRLNTLTGGIGEQGFLVDSDLLGKNTDGSVVQMSNNQIKEFVPAIQGLIALHDDPGVNAKNNITTMTDQYNDLKSKTTGMSDYNIAARAGMRRDMKRLEADINKEYEVFKPENVKRAEANRAQKMLGFASWLNSRGMEDDADAMQVQANEVLEHALAAEKVNKGQMIKTWNEETGEPGPDVVFDAINKIFEWNETDDNGNPIPISANQLGDRKLTQHEPASSDSRATSQDDITVAQMTDFGEEFKTEGMMAATTSHAGKPISANMEKLATIYRNGKAKDTAQPNNLSKQAAKEFYRQREDDYWGDTDSINTVMRDKKLKAIALTEMLESYEADLQEAIESGLEKKRVEMLKRRTASIRNVGSSKKKQREIMIAFTLYDFKQSWRDETGDPYMVVYDPTDTTRQMLYGQRRTKRGR